MLNHIMAVIGLFIGIVYSIPVLAGIISDGREVSIGQSIFFALGWTVFISCMWIV